MTTSNRVLTALRHAWDRLLLLLMEPFIPLLLRWADMKERQRLTRLTPEEVAREEAEKSRRYW